MKQLLTLLLLLLLSACATRKEATHFTENVKGVTYKTIQDSVTHSSKEELQLAKSDKTVQTDRTVTTTTERTFSAPDSIGRQYKLNETITEQRNDYEIKNDINEWLLDYKDKRIAQLQTTNEILQKSINKVLESKKEVKRRSPLWTWLLMYSLGAATVIGIGLWLKKHGLL